MDNTNVKRICDENDGHVSEKDAALDFSSVLASSVHDMKNSVGMLLNSVEGMLQSLSNKTPEEEKHLATLHYEASRINGELVQLLTLYRKNNQFLPVSIDEVFVRDILEDQLARNQSLIETTGVCVEIDCDDALIWYFDEDLVAGVIHNIVLNCFRYTKDQLKISAYKTDDDMLCICIADNGDGYPENMLVKASSSVSSAKIANGETHLGMYFAEQIASMHIQDRRGGKVQVVNNGALGGGEFRLFLP